MELVTMGEAARRIGVSVDTVRRRFRRGELSAQLQRTPQGFIWLIEITERFGPGMTLDVGAAGPAFASASTPADVALPAGRVRALRGMIEVLMHETDTGNRQRESKDRQIDRLRVLLRQTRHVPS